MGPSESTAIKRVFSIHNAAESVIRVGFTAVVLLLGALGWLVLRLKEAPLQYLGASLTALDSQEKDLANIRKYFSQGIVHYRDFIINNRANAAETYNQDLRKEKTAIAGALAAVPPPPADPELKEQFQKDLSEYWAVLQKARSFNSRKKVEDGFDYMHEEVIPARNSAQQSLKDLTDAISSERAKLFARFNQRRQSSFNYFRLTLAATVLATVVLGWFSLQYRASLRRESLSKFDEVARSRDDLEHLSGKLLKIQEEERRRLSRELHDGIGQTLTALRMEIHQAHFNAGPGTQAGERLARARMLAEEAVHTVKDISLLLRPPLLDDLGLEPAIAWQADQFTRRTGIPCRFRSSGLQEMLPDDVKTCVFRVVQEALNNCQKHASPTKAQILIEQRPDTLTVQVEDDGAGFMLNGNNAPVRHSGLGILGMRERAAMLGGTLSLQSSLGMGTRLKLALPLAKMTVSSIPQVEPPSSVPAIGPASS